jgi:hypothetical protein
MGARFREVKADAHRASSLIQAAPAKPRTLQVLEKIAKWPKISLLTPATISNFIILDVQMKSSDGRD